MIKRMNLKATVTIATWNRKNLLETLLISLLDQTIPLEQYEIIVCDSTSQDGTSQMMSKFCAKYPNIKYISNVNNILAEKRNVGITLAVAPIVIFLDDDAIPDRNFVEAHIAGHELENNVVWCGQVRFPEDWVKKSNYFRFRDARHIGVHRQDIDPQNIPFLKLVVMNMSFKKKEIIDKVGLVSEQFRGYGCEDHEFGFRIWRAGLLIKYNEKALVYHFEHGGSIDTYLKKFYHTSRDGVPTLQRVSPECMLYTKMNLLEPVASKDDIKTKLIKLVIHALLRRSIFNLIKSFLIKTDHISILYCPLFFRYIFACSYVYGWKDRKSVEGKKLPVKNGWFS